MGWGAFGLPGSSRSEPEGYFSGDVFNGKHDICETAFANGPRHSPDNAGGLVLSNNAAAGLADPACALGSVVAHAGEDDCENIGAEMGGGGSEELVDGGTAEALWGILIEESLAGFSLAEEFHVLVSGCDPNAAGREEVAVGGLFD